MCSWSSLCNWHPDMDGDIKYREDMCTQPHVGVCSTGVTTKPSDTVVSKGKVSRTHYSLMSSTLLLSRPIFITLQLPSLLSSLLIFSLLSAFSLVPFSVSFLSSIFKILPLFQQPLPKFCWGGLVNLRG